MTKALIMDGCVGLRDRTSQSIRCQFSASAGRVPRIARLMALAIHCARLLAEGVVHNQAELARCGHVTRARISQILGLLNLAPDLQEQLLFFTPVERGTKHIRLSDLLAIASIPDWREQRQRWRKRGLPFHLNQSPTHAASACCAGSGSWRKTRPDC